MLWKVNHCMCRACFSQYQASSAVGMGIIISCQDGDHYQLLGWGLLLAVGMGTITSCTKRREVADRYRILSIIVDTLIARTPQL